MNRLTAIGLASLVAYGLLITTKYTGVVSAARDEKNASSAVSDEAAMRAMVMSVRGEPQQKTVAAPASLARRGRSAHLLRAGQRRGRFPRRARPEGLRRRHQ